MKYYLALNPENKILSAIFVCGKQSFIELTLSEINKKRCVYYSERELKRIKFPEGTKMLELGGGAVSTRAFSTHFDLSFLLVEGKGNKKETIEYGFVRKSENYFERVIL